MNFTTNALFSLSIGIAAAIGWMRVKKTDPAFLPFLFLVWAGLLNELLSISMMKAGFSNVVPFNIFSLIEALLVTWQFDNWELFKKKKKLYYFLQGLFVLMWIGENFVVSDIFHFDSYFSIFHSFLIVFMSIGIINRMMFREPQSLLKHPAFLICMAFIIYFTYSVLIETFWVFGLSQSRFFRVRIYQILAFINLLTNLIFALATLWIPMKQQYILRS